MRRQIFHESDQAFGHLRCARIIFQAIMFSFCNHVVPIVVKREAVKSFPYKITITSLTYAIDRKRFFRHRFLLYIVLRCGAFSFT